MWLFTKIGFFSGTLANFTSKSYADMPRPADWETVPYIMVRGRVRDDLVRLGEFNEARGEKAPAIFHLPGHDYPYRVLLPKSEWVALVAALVADVDYSNFKNAVTNNARTRDEGDARHDLYLDVWRVLYNAEQWLQKRARQLRLRPKGRGTGQGSLGFWMASEPRKSDPRSDADMQALYADWLAEDEEAAIVSDLPEGTHAVFDLDEVIDNPTPEDIARFEAALARPDRRRRRGRR